MNRNNKELSFVNSNYELNNGILKFTPILVVLSGPSCVGKGPAMGAVKYLNPDSIIREIPVIKSYESRPNGELRAGDDPKYFKKSADIEKLKDNSNYVIWKCRDFYQAVNLEDISKTKESINYLEIYCKAGAELMGSDLLSGISVIPVFVSPLSKDELLLARAKNVDLESYVSGLMMSKLIQRSEFDGKDIHSDSVKNNVLERALSAYSEIIFGTQNSNVIVNHDGEGHPNWNRLKNDTFTARPTGDAGDFANNLAKILLNGDISGVEKSWDASVFDN